MKNTYNEPESLEDLMGSDTILFNKDYDSTEPYTKRKLSLEHVEDCECLDCENEHIYDHE